MKINFTEDFSSINLNDQKTCKLKLLDKFYVLN